MMRSLVWLFPFAQATPLQQMWVSTTVFQTPANVAFDAACSADAAGAVALVCTPSNNVTDMFVDTSAVTAATPTSVVYAPVGTVRSQLFGGTGVSQNIQHYNGNPPQPTPSSTTFNMMSSGCNALGQYDPNAGCNGWTATTGARGCGNQALSGANWFFQGSCSGTCANTFRVYCLGHGVTTITPSPTQIPTTRAPTAAPGLTAGPTTSLPSPTTAPTPLPTSLPTTRPSSAPTVSPSTAPTPLPTSLPTARPSSAPTASPTTAPTPLPTALPSQRPSFAPTTRAPTLVDSTTVVFANEVNTTVRVVDIQVVVGVDPMYGPNGTLVVSVQPPNGPSVLTRIVSIDFFDQDQQQKNISGLANPVRFSIPFASGTADPVQICFGTIAALVTPACNWFDLIDGNWKSSGCTTRLTSTQVECTCYHLTDFALIAPSFNRVPFYELLELNPDNIALHPGGIITVSVVILVFAPLLLLAIRRDAEERKHEHLKVEKIQKWDNERRTDAQKKSRKATWCKRYKTGLQVHHTWGSLLFRKSGTSFRSVDRTFVTFFLVFVLLSMSARFHDRDSTVVVRAQVIVYTVLVSLLPAQVLTHLLTHTGEMGFLERWQMENRLKRPSRFRLARYRFPERCRWVLYLIVLACVLGMILYILSIALMFDQNPSYYCLGTTTGSWLIGFIWPYVINVFLLEPIKIVFLVLSTQALQTMTMTTQRTEVEMQPTPD